MNTGSPNGYTISVVTGGWLSIRSCSLGQELRYELLHIKIGQTVTEIWLKTANSQQLKSMNMMMASKVSTLCAYSTCFRLITPEQVQR
jgi:hypothetical protein